MIAQTTSFSTVVTILIFVFCRHRSSEFSSKRLESSENHAVVQSCVVNLLYGSNCTARSCFCLPCISTVFETFISCSGHYTKSSSSISEAISRQVENVWRTGVLCRYSWGIEDFQLCYLTVVTWWLAHCCTSKISQARLEKRVVPAFVTRRAILPLIVSASLPRVCLLVRMRLLSHNTARPISIYKHTIKLSLGFDTQQY